MTGRLSKFPPVCSMASLGSSVLVIAWTLTRWGLTEALGSVATLLLFPAGLCAGAAAALLVAWVRAKGKDASRHPAAQQQDRLLAMTRCDRATVVKDWLCARLTTFFWSAVVAAIAVVASGLSSAAAFWSALALFCAISAAQFIATRS